MAQKTSAETKKLIRILLWNSLNSINGFPPTLFQWSRSAFASCGS
jgi:hypothetical protein